MKEWDGTNILDIFQSFVNEDDLLPEKKHVSFTTHVSTFKQLEKTLSEDLERFRKSPLWSTNLPAQTFHDRVLSVTVDPKIPTWIPVNLDLSLSEIECVNQVLRNRIDDEAIKNKIPYELIDAFINLNHDFQMAGGMVSPTFAEYAKK